MKINLKYIDITQKKMQMHEILQFPSTKKIKKQKGTYLKLSEN